MVSDLAYVRTGAKLHYIRLLIELCNGKIIGHAAGGCGDARFVKASFVTVSFPQIDIRVFHADRGSEFDSAAIDDLIDAF